jgi:SAM-dependent methyltransferase
MGSYRRDLALIHHWGFGFHAELCARGIVELLGPVADRGGSVLEIGCGTGLLTGHLLAAGHRVIASDASEDMLAVARDHLGADVDLRRITLPDDPLPEADAIVSIGHVLNYIGERSGLEEAVSTMARAVRPGGLIAFDLCGLDWNTARTTLSGVGRQGEDWAIVTEYSMPTPDHFVRQMSTFVKEPDGRYRRDEERHDTVLVEEDAIAALLRAEGLESEVRDSFGGEELPPGLHVIVARKEPDRSLRFG